MQTQEARVCPRLLGRISYLREVYLRGDDTL